jgi:hypothetical protein
MVRQGKQCDRRERRGEAETTGRAKLNRKANTGGYMEQ